MSRLISLALALFIFAPSAGYAAGNLITARTARRLVHTALKKGNWLAPATTDRLHVDIDFRDGAAGKFVAHGKRSKYDGNYHMVYDGTIDLSKRGGKKGLARIGGPSLLYMKHARDVDIFHRPRNRQ
jgi:hypothetical protein